MAYGCRIPLFRQEREHRILVGTPDPSFGVEVDYFVPFVG
jgi:hypothetical protein